MGIRSGTKLVRTTVTFPAELIEVVDKAVREGSSPSRNALFVEAVERELQRRHEEEIDRAFFEAADDPDLLAEDLQIMKEFQGADSEAARMLDEMDGGWKE